MALVALFAPAFNANQRPHRHFECETEFGFRVEGNTRDYIPAAIDLFGVYEENLSFWLVEQLRPGDIFVDVGAHIGYFTLLASVRVGDAGGVVAIEASPKTYESLERNVQLNPDAKNTRLVNQAASNAHGSVPIYRGRDESTGITSIRERKGNIFEAEVKCAPLVDILTQDEHARMRLVKMDVEGSEFEAVEGLISSKLDITRPDLEIIVETAADWVYGGRRGSVNDLIELFRREDFNAYAMTKELLVNPRTFSRPVRVRRDPGWGHFDLIFSRRDCAQL